MFQIIALFKIKDKPSFVEFETEAIRILRSHGGNLISAFVPNKELSTLSDFDEVHILEFANRTEFENYKNDQELAGLLELKKAGTEKMDVIFSKSNVSYNK